MTSEKEIDQLINQIKTSDYGLDIKKLYKYHSEIFSGSYKIDFQHILKLLLNKPCPDNEIVTQRELISLSLNKDVNIKGPDIRVSLHSLYHHFDILIELISEEQIINSLSSYSMTKNEQGIFALKEEDLKQNVELLERIILNFSHIIGVDELYVIHFSIVKSLSERNIIDSKSLLVMALRIRSTYEEEEVDHILPIQTQIIESCLDRGAILETAHNQDIHRLNPQIINLLIEKKYLHHQILEVQLFYSEGNTSSIEFALNKDLKLSHFSLSYCILKSDITVDFLKLLIDNIGLDLNLPLNLNNIESFVAIDEMEFNEYVNTVAFQEYEKKYFNNKSNLIHSLVKLNKYELLKFILKNYNINIDAQDSLGKTPLFFAQEQEIAKLLIEHGADIKIPDINGHTWLENLPLSLIDLAYTNNFLTKEHAFKITKQHLLKGNFEYAAKLTKLFKFKLDLDPVNELTESIILSLEISIEKNKYQALINLIDKAGIIIPTKYKYILHSFSDDHKIEEFQFIYGLVHKLAKYYSNNATSKLKNNLQDNSFTEYFKVFGVASISLDNEFTLEALTINGLRPNKLEKEALVYRGMSTILSPEDIDGYFQYGHRSFSVGEYQKTLGFYVNEPWNELGANWLRWEFGSTYTALQPTLAAGFAVGQSSTSTSSGMGTLIEMKMLSNSPKICGGWQDEISSELIFGTIEGQNIIAIYKISETKEGYKVVEAYMNPYHNETKTRFQTGEEIPYSLEENQRIEEYYNFGCKDLPINSSTQRSSLYHSYNEFMEKYTTSKYIDDQNKLREDYFQEREIFVDVLTGECNLELECCLEYF